MLSNYRALLLLTLDPQVSSAKSDMIEQNVIFMQTKLLTVILKIKFNAYIPVFDTLILLGRGFFEVS